MTVGLTLELLEETVKSESAYIGTQTNTHTHTDIRHT